MILLCDCENANQTIADLAWMRNQQTIEAAVKHEKKIRKEDVYNAHAESMVKLYIDNLFRDQ